MPYPGDWNGKVIMLWETSGVSFLFLNPLGSFYQCFKISVIYKRIPFHLSTKINVVKNGKRSSVETFNPFRVFFASYLMLICTSAPLIKFYASFCWCYCCLFSCWDSKLHSSAYLGSLRIFILDMLHINDLMLVTWIWWTYPLVVSSHLAPVTSGFDADWNVIWSVLGREHG